MHVTRMAASPGPFTGSHQTMASSGDVSAHSGLGSPTGAASQLGSIHSPIASFRIATSAAVSPFAAARGRATTTPPLSEPALAALAGAQSSLSAGAGSGSTMDPALMSATASGMSVCSSDRNLLPELQRHIAEVDAALSYGTFAGRPPSWGGPLSSLSTGVPAAVTSVGGALGHAERSLLSSGALPASLQVRGAGLAPGGAGHAAAAQPPLLPCRRTQSISANQPGSSSSRRSGWWALRSSSLCALIPASPRSWAPAPARQSTSARPPGAACPAMSVSRCDAEPPRPRPVSSCRCRFRGEVCAAKEVNLGRSVAVQVRRVRQLRAGRLAAVAQTGRPWGLQETTLDHRPLPPLPLHNRSTLSWRPYACTSFG